MVELDIAKAYDTGMTRFRRRGMPQELIDAYWREHEGRSLAFRTTDGRVQFTVTPAQGMPQGAPESPMVYAALMEDMLGDIQDELLANCLSAGVTLDREGSPAEVEAAKSTRRRFQHGDLAMLNFSDDTYIICATAEQASYVMGIVAKHFAKANQRLSASKNEALVTPAGGRRGSVYAWDEAQLADYVAAASRRLGKG